MTDVGGGEYRLTDRPKRLPHINPCRRGGSSIARWEWSMQVACSCTPSRQDSCEDVIFMSGLADEGAFWDDQVAGLRDRWRITTFDNRGVGRSETPPGEYRTTSFAADTIAFMESLGIEHAHVVGSSMGGAIAQELTLAHPGRVRSLVLNGTYCREEHFFREVIRSWQWAAQKSNNLRDFLNLVNLWCPPLRIYNSGIMEEWLTTAVESPHAPSVNAVLPLGRRTARARHLRPCGRHRGADARHGGRARPVSARALRARAGVADSWCAAEGHRRSGPPAVPGGTGRLQRALGRFLGGNSRRSLGNRKICKGALSVLASPRNGDVRRTLADRSSDSQRRCRRMPGVAAVFLQGARGVSELQHTAHGGDGRAHGYVSPHCGYSKDHASASRMCGTFAKFYVSLSLVMFFLDSNRR